MATRRPTRHRWLSSYQGATPRSRATAASSVRWWALTRVLGSSAWACSLPAELLETAARIFRAEAKDGYRDRVVIGGLSGFVEKLRTGAGDEVANLLGAYAPLAPSEREPRLKQAQSLLGGSAPVRAAPPAPLPPRADPK